MIKLNRNILIMLAVTFLAMTACRRQIKVDRYTKAAEGEELVTVVDQPNIRINSWLVRDTNNIPLRWICDKNHDGIPESWSFFKDGKAFLDEVDFDHDGKVDTVYLHVLSEDKTRVREFSFSLDDQKRNIFTEREDTGWQDLQKQEKKVR